MAYSTGLLLSNARSIVFSNWHNITVCSSSTSYPGSGPTRRACGSSQSTLHSNKSFSNTYARPQNQRPPGQSKKPLKGPPASKQSPRRQEPTRSWNTRILLSPSPTNKARTKLRSQPNPNEQLPPSLNPLPLRRTSSLRQSPLKKPLLFLWLKNNQQQRR